MNKYITLALITLVAGITFGQNVDFKSGNFKDDKDGLKKAQDAIKAGDSFFELGNTAIFETKEPGINFELALNEFMKAQTFNPNNALLNFKIGVCHINSTSPYKGFSFIERAKQLDPQCDPFMDYYVGVVLQYQGKYGDAVKAYQAFENNYKKSDNFAKFVTQRKGQCKFAEQYERNPVRCWVDNVKELNTPHDEIAPSITTDGAEIVFSSNRPNKNKPNEAGGYDMDIYSSSAVDGKWQKAIPLPGSVNTATDDVSNNLYYDGTKMLIHRDNNGQTDIYETVLQGLNWSEPRAMHYNINSKANERFASYDFDNYRVYYARDNANRSNGYDLFVSGVESFKEKTFGMGVPVSILNTRFHDGPVFLHLDGETMYFASEGHESMGGYDIFMSKKVNGQWTKPVNLGYPINTPYDDFFFASTANGKFAYIASNRDGGEGGYDIYKVTFWGPEKQPAVVTEDYLLASRVMPMKDGEIEATVEVKKKSLTVFKGRTIDDLTGKPVEAVIEIIDNTTGKVIQNFTTNSATGKFIISLNSGKNYGIAVKADGYLFHSENFDIPDGSVDNLVDKEIRLKNIKIGSKIALRNIFFDVGKATLRSESNAELDRLVKLMKDVPKLKIEISGHTDNTGSAALNDKLSQERAEAVMNYLKSKGIAADRMTAVGYGSNRPIASNNNAEGRQENRRTEMEIKGN
jgi:outer membrane protein OmpA-like peptidoglycan-associated protein/tetratricopeptide (TPR) repeat protein